MGRFDALTTLDLEPVKPAAPTEKPASQNRPARAPLPEKKAIAQTTSKPASRQTGLHANLQTGKDASRQTGKPVSMQTGKPTKMQTSKQVSLQTGKQVIIEKYSSYLTHEYKRELKRIAWESDRNEYEVLIEAVEQYLAGHTHPK
jgi:co-chaperonin GroES (HSP10)